jgi:hypothetical protein
VPLAGPAEADVVSVEAVSAEAVPVGVVLVVEPPALLGVLVVELDGGGLAGVVVVDEGSVVVPTALGAGVGVPVGVVPVLVVGSVGVGVVVVGAVLVSAVVPVVVGVVPVVAVGSVVAGAAPVVLVDELGPLAAAGDGDPVVPAPPEGSVAVVPAVLDPAVGEVVDAAGVAPVGGVAPPPV